VARPLTLAEIEATFKKWGVPYTVTSGAATRSNSSHWGDKNSVTGCMYHHTAGDARDALELAVIRDGRTGLSGPLANFGVGDDGKVYVVAVGSANHAGGGDPETLALVQQEKTPLTSEIKPNEQASSPRSVGGNSRFYGWEVFYGIRNDPTVNPLQHRSTVLSMAAIIDKLDEIDKANTWSGKAVIGHREWTTNKIDPSGIKMYEVRTTVNSLRSKGPAAAKVWHATGKFPSTSTTTPPATPAKPPTTGGTVAPEPVYKSAEVKALFSSDAFEAPDQSTTNPYWSGASYFRYLGRWVRETVIAIREVKADVKAIRALLEKDGAA
jgi:hypothetical protein